MKTNSAGVASWILKIGYAFGSCAPPPSPTDCTCAFARSDPIALRRRAQATRIRISARRPWGSTPSRPSRTTSTSPSAG
eukprot:7383490-Prymnesium_polylepis.1